MVDKASSYKHPNKTPDNMLTRSNMKELEEQIQVLQQRIDNWDQTLDHKLDEKFDQKLDSLDKLMEEKMEKFINKINIHRSHERWDLENKEDIPHTESSREGENRYNHGKSSFQDNSMWNRIPKIDVNKFDGTDPSGWLSQMEQYFTLHNITDDLVKLRVAVLYLDSERWKWYQWHKKSCEGTYFAWSHFVKALTARFDREDNFLGRLTKLRQTGDVKDFITTFEQLAVRTENLTDTFYMECFISGLKEAIQAQVRMQRPATWLEACKRALEAELVIKSQAPRPSFTPRARPPTTTSSTQPLKIQKLSQEEMVERQRRGLCYNCDEKYFRGHKCKEQKLFQIDMQTPTHPEENAPEESLMDEPEEHTIAQEEPETQQEEPLISLHALVGMTSPQTLKIKGYIKHQPVVILIDSGSTHNFIHRRIADKVNCFIRPVSNFQILIANGGRMACGGKCENVKLEMADYHLKTHMFAIDMGGCDIVLGAEWLRTLGPITMDFKELYMRFTLDSYTYTLKGLDGGKPEIISSHRMEKLLKKGHHGVIARLNAIQVMEDIEPEIHPDMQAILSKQSHVFDTPKGLPPSRGEHDHSIPLLPGSHPPNVRPYRYPFHQKNEIEKIVQELLETGAIRPSTSPYSSPVVMVLKKEGAWRMCPDFRALNMLTIKDKFPIPVIDDLLDELKGAQFFTKLDLRSGYHQIRMKEEDIPKTAFRTHEGHYEFLVMPFGLCNAPSTFQSLMNKILKPYLRHFILVFFDDILIYSKTWESHLQHVDKALQLLRNHQLFVKRSKCSFGVSEVEYLGHIVGRDGVRVDPKKIQAMQDWPRPKTLKNLRGFLGLTGYYRKFVKNYGKIAAPLTKLLRKNAFTWNDVADQAFSSLKQAMCTTPVLAIPDFSKPFVLECDASGTGLGAVLTQEGRPLAFTSKQLCDRNLGKSTYEKEMMAILHAVDTWRPYLIGRHFKIKTDHHSLKYFLEQRLSSSEQQKWVTKMLGYDYEIIYKKGKDNVVADALSRKYEEQGSLLSLSSPVLDWLEEAQQEWSNDSSLSQVIKKIQENAQPQPGYTWQDDTLRYKDRLVLSSNSALKHRILTELHSSPLAGHSGFQKTYARARRSFFWQGMKKDIHTFVEECDTCQRHKGETVKTPGALQPLPIPATIWTEISMDFIVGLPKSGNKSIIMVIVDRLSKYAHFCALQHPLTPASVAQVFMDQIFKLHGMPTSIVSDRDPTFTSKFWQELFKIQGTQLNMSTAYHPQTDGQTEAVNKCVETYLRCFASEKQHQWAKWLPLAEWWYNTSYHATTKMTPYEAVYGQQPPSVLTYLPGSSKVQAVDNLLQNRDVILKTLKDNLVLAQNRMKQQVDQHRSERTFEEGDQVFLRLQPYKQTSLKDKGHQKLSPKFYGPYQILQRIGQVAYKLALPAHSKIHPVFHVSCLKKVVGQNCRIQTKLPELDEEGSIWLHPEAVLSTRERQLRQRTIKEVLIQWKDTQPEDATWEPSTILQQFPDLQP